MPHRYAIVGATGSGKTTLAEEIGRQLTIPVIDLDGLHWGPNWTMTPKDIFRERVSAALQDPSWVVGGNYSKARDIIWARAESLIWLDYPLPLVSWRLFRRTVRRIVTRQELWNGNRETWQGQFMSRESLFLWLLRSQRQQRREYPLLLSHNDYKHLHLSRFNSPKETRRWLITLSQQ
jgi:adenylate kinase family enzyme